MGITIFIALSLLWIFGGALNAKRKGQEEMSFGEHAGVAFCAWLVLGLPVLGVATLFIMKGLGLEEGA